MQRRGLALGQRRPQLGLHGRQPPRQPVKPRPRFGEGQPPALLGEQLHPVLRFQRADVLGHRRLAQVQRLGAAHRRFFLHQREKCGQFRVHHGPFPLLWKTIRIVDKLMAISKLILYERGRIIKACQPRKGEKNQEERGKTQW